MIKKELKRLRQELDDLEMIWVILGNWNWPNSLKWDASEIEFDSYSKKDEGEITLKIKLLINGCNYFQKPGNPLKPIFLQCHLWKIMGYKY